VQHFMTRKGKLAFATISSPDSKEQPDDEREMGPYQSPSGVVC